MIDQIAASYVGRAARRWGGTSLVALACAIGLRPNVQSPWRVAIEVDCTAPGACALAESIALDVWSEQRGPSLPLAVVVSSDSLRNLISPPSCPPEKVVSGST